MQYSFYFDEDRCTGCNSCTAACLDWNNIRPDEGVQWRRVLSIEKEAFPKTKLVNISLACRHCAKPVCRTACPVEAIEKRSEDGIVVVDRAKCIGCHSCFSACPFGVPQFGDDGTMQKCDFCLERLSQGLRPACVASCPCNALHFGTPKALSDVVQERKARKLAFRSQPGV